jgi:sialidase-1
MARKLIELTRGFLQTIGKEMFCCMGLLFFLFAPLTASERPGIFDEIIAPSAPNSWRNSEGTMARLNDGRLLLAWTDFYGPDEDECDCKPARISAVTSSDEGRTWGKRFTIQENIGKQNVMSPNLLRLKSGKLLFIFLVKDSSGDSRAMARLSSDDAKTFSQPREIPITPSPSYRGFNNDRLIQLDSGRVLLPMFILQSESSAGMRFLSRVYSSDDDGATWAPSLTTVDVKESKAGAQEPGVVELKDGRVMLWNRTSTGQIYRAYSSDKGLTWSTPEPMGVAAPVSPASIKRIPSTGDLLLVWNNSPKYRFPLTTAISKNDGRTWRTPKNLEENPCCTYAYASITFDKDRCLFTYYVDAGTRPGGDPPKPKIPSSIPGAWVANWSLKLKSVSVSWLYE